MRRRSLKPPRAAGQTTLEYAMGAAVMVGLAAGLWMFYQGFVEGNLFGGGTAEENRAVGIWEQSRAFGLETVVMLPFP